MNQDNYLCEALKMRNLLAEFCPPQYSSAPGPSARWATATQWYCRRLQHLHCITVSSRKRGRLPRLTFHVLPPLLPLTLQAPRAWHSPLLHVQRLAGEGQGHSPHPDCLLACP